MAALCALVVLSQGCDRDAELEVEPPEPERPIVQGQAHGLLIGTQFLPRTFARLAALEDGGTGRLGVMQLGASHTEALHFSDEFSERLGARFGSLGPGYVPLISNRPHFVEPAAASERSRIRVTQQGWQFATALYADPGQAWGLNGTRAVAQAGAVAVFQFEPEVEASDAGTGSADGGAELLTEEEASLLDGGARSAMVTADPLDAGAAAEAGGARPPSERASAPSEVAVAHEKAPARPAVASQAGTTIDAGASARRSRDGDAGKPGIALVPAEVDAGKPVSAARVPAEVDAGKPMRAALVPAEIDAGKPMRAALVPAEVDAGKPVNAARVPAEVDAGKPMTAARVYAPTETAPPLNAAQMLAAIDAGTPSAALEAAVDAGAPLAPAAVNTALPLSAAPEPAAMGAVETGTPEDGGASALEGPPPVVPGQLQLYYLDGTASARMKLVIDGVEHRLPAFGGTRVARIARYPLKARPRRVEVHSPVAGATVYGLAYERTGAGVVYDVAGLSGSSVYVTDRYQVAAFSTQLRARKPALFLLFYGTNESVMSKVTARDYRARYRSLLQKLRRAAPDAECLLISNTDREVPTDEGTWVGAPNATVVEETIQQVAADERCAFWSARAAMGGAGGMRAWLEKEPPLALADRTHLSELGYRELAASLVEDLLGAYRDQQD